MKNNPPNQLKEIEVVWAPHTPNDDPLEEAYQMLFETDPSQSDSR